MLFQLSFPYYWIRKLVFLDDGICFCYYEASNLVDWHSLFPGFMELWMELICELCIVNFYFWR